MIKSTKLLVIDKTDVNRLASEKLATEWSHTDLRQKSLELLKTSDLVIALDEKGNTTILKSRWGKCGVVVSHEDYNKFIKLRYENNKSSNPSKKKSFLGRVYPFNFWPFNKS
jgi:hypothetical protein